MSKSHYPESPRTAFLRGAAIFLTVISVLGVLVVAYGIYLSSKASGAQPIPYNAITPAVVAPKAILSANPKFKVGVWLQITGTDPRGGHSDTLGVNLNLSATPVAGQWWKGFESKWSSPCYGSLKEGDVILVHWAGMNYRLDDISQTTPSVPMLADMVDYKEAWGRVPTGIRVVQYLGAPYKAGSVSGADATRRVTAYLQPYGEMGMSVATDVTAFLGQTDPPTPIGSGTKKAMLAYHKSHTVGSFPGWFVEPWVHKSCLSELRSRNIGVMVWTGEIARWQATPKRHPDWFPLPSEIGSPLCMVIDNFPLDWSTMPTSDRVEWLFQRAKGILFDGHVPFVPMSLAPAVLARINAEFGRDQPNE